LNASQYMKVEAKYIRGFFRVYIQFLLFRNQKINIHQYIEHQRILP